MQLFRHYFVSDEDNQSYKDTMIDNLRDFGFTLNDGKEIP